TGLPAAEGFDPDLMPRPSVEAPAEMPSLRKRPGESDVALEEISHLSHEEIQRRFDLGPKHGLVIPEAQVAQLKAASEGYHPQILQSFDTERLLGKLGTSIAHGDLTGDVFGRLRSFRMADEALRRGLGAPDLAVAAEAEATKS